MRDDMARVIVERPRLPDSGFGRKGRSRPIENLPFYEGMRRPHLLLGEGKTLNENLKPLRRYLEGQVGRPWNKVYAEIAANLRVDSTVQQHVRDHVTDVVAIQPRHLHRAWGWSRTLWWQPLYVDPRTGLLCRTDRLPGERKHRTKPTLSPPPERIPLAEDRALWRIQGTWYEVRLAPLPTPVYRDCPERQIRRLKPYNRRSPLIEMDYIVRRLVTPAVWDVATNSLIEVGPLVDDRAGWLDYGRVHPDRRYTVAKRALNRRELRLHELSNDASAI